MLRVLLSFLFLVTTCSCVTAAADYRERLVLRPLPQSALLASFNFRSNASSSSFEQQNFRFFPRSLGQILQHAHARELHLRFSWGRWDAESWGARPWDGAREGGTGVELWAWVEAATDEEADARWLTLTNALSGLFCASLNFVDSTRTIRPVMSFQPEGYHRNTSLSNLHLLHGTLPHEVVCTENLTPFLKLLPCKGKAGISSLLDGHKLFDASWQTMAVDVRPVCPADGAECTLEVERTVDMVLDINRSKRPRDNPIPRPVPIETIPCDTTKPYNSDDSCYPLDRNVEPSWSLKEVFGHPVKGSCLLNSASDIASTEICINVPPEREIDAHAPARYRTFTFADGHFRCYEPEAGDDFDLVLPEQNMNVELPLAQPRLYAARSITGHGQERGGIVTVLTNPSSINALDLVYLESLPWFMKPYLHTLRASVFPSTGNSSDGPIKQIYYRPAVDRRRGTHLELLLTVPPASTLTLTYDFEKAILRYTEYPPDANRGFDVAPAVIRLLPTGPNKNTSEGSDRGTYLRTTSLLLYLPTPDFSMPYNVIILTSTVMALGFGSMFNLLTRRFVGADEVESSGLARLKEKLAERLQRVRAKFQAKGAKVE